MPPALLSPPAAAPPVPASASEPAPAGMTEAEYLAFERSAPHNAPRHEFVTGELIEMAGASRVHNLIARRAGRAFEDLLVGRAFEVYQSDMRLRVPSGRFRYPDVVVAPSPPDLLPGGEQDTLLNPAVLVEVLSPSTATTDRVDKQAEYRSIPSLTDYLILSQDEPRCDHYSRLGPEAWKLVTLAGPDAALTLHGLRELSLGSLYPPAG